MYRLTIGDLLDRFKKGTLTCEGYTKRMIQRAEDLKIFNYFVSMDTERMLQKAKEADARYQSKSNRPLEGILIAIKDNIDVEGEATGACTPGLAGLKPKHTAEVAKRLFDAGAIHAGRTNMHELAFGVSTINTYTGDSHNFHNFDYICGGSSGGSGGAVAADIVPVALGTDTGGSIRIPSSFNGVFGLRTTSGRWPADYGVKMSHVRDSVGPLTRSADDIAILDHVMAGEEPLDDITPAEIRIGVARPHFWEGLDPAVQEYAEKFLAELKDKGFIIIDEGEVPGVAEMVEKYIMPTINYELLPRLEEYMEHHGHKVTVEDVFNKIASPDVKELFKDTMKNPVSPELYQETMAARDKLREDMKKYFEDHQLDCILMPANKIPPPLISAFDTDPTLLMAVIQNFDCGNICNNPSLVIPGGRVRGSGVPFGMQIEGLTGNDRRLIAVAKAIEKALEL
ncbi:mandelamide hydrolase-like [Asterias rubens]|uniref:mandelamide hydrolase-like n=1 Tax=Asterias rubens TaxID=7604 RepID=UPI001455921B|nr:mandelamide hydrolase-like [Asterias rubens]